MKYDSGMTQFHKDIIAALRYMLGNDSEITEKFSPKDGSPAPLRDYLKTFYSKSFDEPVSDKLRFTCTPTNFKIAFDDMLLNNKGEKELTMTWSQVTKFIRDNWDEVFKKDKPKSRPLETLVKTFDETEITCPNWLPGKTLTYLEAVNGIHFECKAFSMEFCKLDDITKFFVQHCNCPENCLYCKDSAEKQFSYIDKLREEYPKINETDDWFYGTYCPAELFVGKNVIDFDSEKCNYPDEFACQKCWRERCPENISFIENEDFEKEYFENYPEEESSEAASENSEEKAEADNSDGNQIAVNTETALQGAFDYSELDGDTAKNLRDCETVIRQETAGYFTLLGAKFKEARELLANHANGTFEKWYTAMGFKRQTVYNLIQRYDFLGSPTIGGREDTFEALPLTLSYEVSKPDAPAELVEKVLDGDITTNAEYIKLKAELDRTREECRQLDANSAAKDKEYERELKEANNRAEKEKKARENIDQAMKHVMADCQKFKDKNAELEKQVKELESRPVDVAVQDNSDLMEELEELREENARLKDGVLHMVIRLTLDEYGNLVKLTQDDDALNYAVKHSHIFKS